MQRSDQTRDAADRPAPPNLDPDPDRPTPDGGLHHRPDSVAIDSPDLDQTDFDRTDPDRTDLDQNDDVDRGDLDRGDLDQNDDVDRGDLDRGDLDRGDAVDPDRAAPASSQGSMPPPSTDGDAAIGVAEVPSSSTDAPEVAERSPLDEPVRDRTAPTAPVEHHTGEPQPAADAVLGTDRAAEFQERWREVQTSFVDDPAIAVRDADQLVTEVVSALTSALEERQRSLGSAWREAPDTGTEELRTALMRYRATFRRLIEV